ncbi:hypothetical protein [Rahnella sp. ChDrAdgB13]|uniref:hypothetical protein n=1 Tax=Rahnella sp. ChDrAdgB13 TaxID=1850581 RepID=UPI001AD85AE2
MYIPDDLIKGLVTTDGPVLLYFCAGVPTSGFLLREDEFVTSLRTFQDARKKAGLPPTEYRRNRL